MDDRYLDPLAGWRFPLRHLEIVQRFKDKARLEEGRQKLYKRMRQDYRLMHMDWQGRRG